MCIDLVIIVTFFTYYCCSTTTRKRRVYKNITRYTRCTKCTKCIRCTKAPYPNQSFFWYSQPIAQKRFWSPPMASTHDGLTYDKANSFALQATTTHGVYGRVVASYQQYEYNNDLSEGLPIINDTSTMTTWVKGCQLSTIRVQKWPM